MEEQDKVEDLESPEQDDNFETHKPKQVHDGSGHKHIYIPDFQDDEGRQHFTCAKCWAGKYERIK